MHLSAGRNRLAAVKWTSRVGNTFIRLPLRHPVSDGAAGFTFAHTELPVAALHPYPIRTFAYMDTEAADLFGLSGVSNGLQLVPSNGATVVDVQRELFQIGAVASAESVTASTQLVNEQMEQFVGILQFMAIIVLVMAVLIAFLTASISLDARVREHATMFAFGVPVRTALRMAMTESLIMGVMGTVLGIAGGLVALWWMVTALLSSTLPEFGMRVLLTPQTIMITLVLGVVAVAVAPVFTVRRMRRIDLPGTLRLME